MQKRMSVRRLFILASVLLVLVFSGKTQTPKSSLLWEISGNGLKQPSHLFGTFHLICRNDFPITDILKSKIKASGQFFGEINMDDPELETSLMMKLMLADKTLQLQIGAADFKKVSEQFQKITGLPIVTFNSFKPFMCISTLLLNCVTCADKIQPDIEFMHIAKQNKLVLKGLETIDDQLNAIDKEPLDSQINTLKKVVLNFDSVKNVMSQLVTVYKKRDVDSLYQFMLATGASDDMQSELLDKRNEKWIPVMKKAMAEKPSFFAVGAGHLGGQDGIISLLRKQGYTVTPVAY